MSVKKELENATGLKKGRSESDEDYAKKVIDKITELPDEDWAKLSKQAQAWFNESVDALNDNKEVPVMPSEEPEDSGKRVRRGADKEDSQGNAEWVPKPGEVVIVTTKRGKVYEGEFMELDGDVAVVKVDGEEMEFTADRTASMVPKVTHAAAKEKTSEQPVVGDLVTLVTKRGIMVSGKIVEQDDEVVVLEINGQDAEYQRNRIESLVLIDRGRSVSSAKQEPPQVGDIIKAVTKRNKEVEGKVVEIDGNILVVETSAGDVEVDTETAQSIEIVLDEKAAGRTRRGTTDGAGKTEKPSGKTTKADNGGVSVGARMREVICENLDLKVDLISKLLEKENLSFKEATLKIVFKDVHTVVELLKQNKHFKY